MLSENKQSIINFINWRKLMRILVIEDEYSLADMIRECLEKEKYIVDIASDGEEGLFFKV